LPAHGVSQARKQTTPSEAAQGDAILKLAGANLTMK
jgi:hypothetical protein